MTTHQTETWLAALSVFEVPVVNRAVLQFGLSADPFPDLGKIIIECQKASTSDEYRPHHDPEKVTNSTIAAVAQAMGLEV